MNFEEAKKNYCDFLLKNGAICIRNPEEEPFQLRSGGRSRISINFTAIGCDSDSFSALLKAIAVFLPRNNFVLCNVDSKISPQMVGALAYALHAPQILYKSDELLLTEKGVMKQISIPKSIIDSVFILDDVGTSGSTVIKVSKLIREILGMNIDITLLIGLVREPEVLLAALKEHNIFYKSIVTLDELLTMHWKSFSISQQNAILMERKLKV